MSRLIAADPRNREKIIPLLGGEELNDSPTQTYRRFVIDFSGLTEDEARRWPMLFHIVEEKVKPQRLALRDVPSAQSRKDKWWRWSRETAELYACIRPREKALVCCQTSKYLSFTFCPSSWIFTHKTVVLAFDKFAQFSVVQSRLHQEWSYFFGSTLEDRPVFTPSDCFETFPFPDCFATDPKLDVAGKEYYEFRAALMVKNNEGLTKTYNRFHDPNERSPDLLQLRELHAAMDRAVLDAYGWTDLKPRCEFLLDYEEEEDEDEGSGVRNQGSGRRRKKPWRYRWPDDFRDVVLARLLELNKQRAEEERLRGEAAEKAKPGVRRTRKGKQGPELYAES
jgi:hypothetical protein